MSSASEDDVAPHNLISFDGGSSPLNHSTIESMLQNESNNLYIPDIDVEGFCHNSYHLEQYAMEVFDFSSQYGIEYSISYTANNICGRPTKYPNYGDFPETFAMRTYGNWWDGAPSRLKEIQPRNLPKIPAQDFIVLCFEDFIIPEKIFIYETFNPGSIVRIWAYTIDKRWICLWENSDFYKKAPPSGNTARRFTPALKKISMPSRTIRLEFNHSRLNYFTEIDAVLLSGRSYLANAPDMKSSNVKKQKGTILRKVQSLQIRPADKNSSPLHDFLKSDLNKFITGLPNSDNISGTSIQKKMISLGDMPFEIMLNIFSYLDLASLFRIGQVSRYCYDVSTHPLLYTEINLKHFWHLATNELLCTLACRATVLKKLDLSWCGMYNTISATEFKKFVQQRGDSLTHLRLNSCPFLNASCIETVGIVCDNLKELSLRNFDIENPYFSCLGNLKNLERLDLFRTIIEADLLLRMLECNRKLKHLNLVLSLNSYNAGLGNSEDPRKAYLSFFELKVPYEFFLQYLPFKWKSSNVENSFCGITINMDDVAKYIGTYNRELISLDMWKSHYLTASGLLALSNCHDLEEVDFGWCLREVSLGDSLREFLTKCPKLKKLFLATVRGVTDRDVEHIANVCKHLEQLDLMGVLGISKERYHDILLKCKKLQLLDLSFCDNLLDHEIRAWSQMFNVKIKCSHVPL